MLQVHFTIAKSKQKLVDWMILSKFMFHAWKCIPRVHCCDCGGWWRQQLSKWNLWDSRRTSQQVCFIWLHVFDPNQVAWDKSIFSIGVPMIFRSGFSPGTQTKICAKNMMTDCQARNWQNNKLVSAESQLLELGEAQFFVWLNDKNLPENHLWIQF